MTCICVPIPCVVHKHFQGSRLYKEPRIILEHNWAWFKNSTLPKLVEDRAIFRGIKCVYYIFSVIAYDLNPMLVFSFAKADNITGPIQSSRLINISTLHDTYSTETRNVMGSTSTFFFEHLCCKSKNISSNCRNGLLRSR